jgi:hypothetical protein
VTEREFVRLLRRLLVVDAEDEVCACEQAAGGEMVVRLHDGSAFVVRAAAVRVEMWD